MLLARWINDLICARITKEKLETTKTASGIRIVLGALMESRISPQKRGENNGDTKMEKLGSLGTLFQ